ncbi:putative calmodulin [Gregarina niphandrodes]|uniref:Calmodulin n=1 Tax=Gregarina niphandrodes TaxID=110365 RepID=A0A023B2Z2_GRENI|nr:putative calmodulin [Gregarina niphandrodes]EZG55290.1 putative calmodulin [Gregarina niphandrodes]|eukprot:XP_011131669.1 putative calmodulin [Gregarina niphandrodes]
MSHCAPSDRYKEFVLSPKQRSELEDAFKVFEDRSNPGTVKVENLVHLLRALDQHYTWKELLILSQHFNSKGITSLDFEETLSLFLSRVDEEPDRELLEEAFAIFDKDRTNTVDLGFFKRCLTTQCDQVPVR